MTASLANTDGLTYQASPRPQRSKRSRRRWRAPLFCLCALLLLAGASFDAPGDREGAWDYREGLPQPQKELRLAGALSKLAFSPDGQRLLTLSRENISIATMWDLRTGRAMFQFSRHEYGVGGLAFSPDGKVVASTGHDHRGPFDRMKGALLLVWDSTSGEVLWSAYGNRDQKNGIAFSPDGKYLATTEMDDTVRFRDVKTGKVARVFQVPWSPDVIAFSPDGKQLVCWGGDCIFSFHDVVSGRQLRCIETNQHVGSIAFSPDGRWLAAGGGGPFTDMAVAVWDLRDSGNVIRLAGHKRNIYTVAFHPRGRYLASGGDDGVVRIWDLKAKKLVYALDSSFPENGPNRWTCHRM